MAKQGAEIVQPNKGALPKKESREPYRAESQPSEGLNKRLFGGDRVLWIIIAALAVVSLLVVYSSTASLAYKQAGGDTSLFIRNQLKFFVLGFLTIFLVHRINYQTFDKYARTTFLIALFAMGLTFLFGVDLNDASRWLKIPGTSYTIQPADFLKVSLILLLAKELAKRQATIKKRPLIPVIPLFHPKFSEKRKQQNKDIFLNTTVPILLPIAATCIAIFISNLSTAIIVFITCIIMLIIGRVRWREIFRFIRMTFAVMLVVLTVMYIGDVGRARTWGNRITQFVGTEESATPNIQVEQAKIAVATGGIKGKGPGMSTQRANLPHSYSDYAYAFIIEEYGLIGAIITLALYMWLFFRTVLISQKCKRGFPSLLVLGLGVMIFIQALVNMMVSVNLMPTTGQTLPLVSLGGSSVLFTSLALGMILGVSRQMEEETLGDEVSETS